MKPACFPPHRSFATGCLLLAAGLFFFTGLSARAVTITYNDPVDLYNEILDTNPSTGKANDPESRTCAQYVLEAYAAAANGGAAVVDSQITFALTRLRNMQDINTAGSPTHGNFAWSKKDQTSPGVVAVNDQNAGEFVVQALAQVPLLYHTAELQNSANAASITQILTDALTGIYNHTSVTPTYTNIAITKSWNLVVLGQVLPNAQAIEDGRDAFDAWLTQTRTDGIHEFLSPTYYGSDMDSLGFLYLYAKDESISAKAGQALKLFWIELYANWFHPNERMSGAHSRTYDFLKDNGSTDKYYYAAGLITTRTPKYWRALDVMSWSVPAPTDVPGLFATLPLRILRDFNGNPPTSQFATNYIGAAVPGFSPGYSVGSTTIRYDDPTSEALTINLPCNHDASAINFNTEGRYDPYLQNKVTGTTSVAKAIHLKPFVASVQRGAEVLFLASSDGTTRKKDANGHLIVADSTVCIESSLIFPNEAEIWLGTNTTATTLAQNASLNVPAGTTIFFRLNGVATGVRFLQTTHMTGGNASLNIVADGYDPGDGSTYYAKRITCVHYPSVPTYSTGREIFAFWTRTAPVADDAAFLTFRQNLTNATGLTNSYTFSTGAVSLAVPGMDGLGNLSVSANVNTETLGTLGGAESGLTSSLINVNGTDYVTPTLQTWTGTAANHDIGTVGVAGGSSEAATGGVLTVSGAGSDIWTAADSFHLTAQKLHGDGYIIARLVTFPSSGINEWAKAGVMLRDTLLPGSLDAFTCQTSAHGSRFSKRTTANALSTRTGLARTNRPLWLKIVRQGNTFTGYSSIDGTTWTQEDGPATIAMGADIYAGLAVTSCDTSTAVSATFDNVGVFQQ